MRLALLAVTAAMIPLFAACGRGTSEYGGGGGGPGGEDSGAPNDSGGLDAGGSDACASGCACAAFDTPVCVNGQCTCVDPSCAGQPVPVCPGPCPGDPNEAPSCNDGQWGCPVVGGGIFCSPKDAGEDAGECQGPVPFCGNPCGGEALSPQCLNGFWECPEEPLCPPPEDAGGPDACATEGPPPCPDTPCGEYYPICEYGLWSCIYNGGTCVVDAGPPPPPVDSGPSLFSCGNQECDPTTTFCAILVGAGVPNEDSGVGTNSYCVPLPSGCESGATCGCLGTIQAPGQCDCLQSGSDVVVTCLLP
jgi:hypothetical protein